MLCAAHNAKCREGSLTRAVPLELFAGFLSKSEDIVVGAIGNDWKESLSNDKFR